MKIINVPYWYVYNILGWNVYKIQIQITMRKMEKKLRVQSRISHIIQILDTNQISMIITQRYLDCVSAKQM